VQIDPDGSLLFPDLTYGLGDYVPGAGLRVTVAQEVGATLGDQRNHFGGRPLERHLTLDLTQDGESNLSGSFKETLYGLFTNPVALEAASGCSTCLTSKQRVPAW